MHDLLIVENFGHKPKRVFKVRVPDLADIGCYRSVQHIEGFRKREIQRALSPSKSNETYSAKLPWYSIDPADNQRLMVQGAFERSYPHALPVPAEGQMLVYKWLCEVIPLEGMPAFFEAIGYDYKAKKYLPESVVVQHAQETQHGIHS